MLFRSGSSCVYAKNAVMAAPGFEKQLMGHLEVFVKAGVRLGRWRRWYG